VRDVTEWAGERSFRLASVLHVVFTTLLVLVCVFMGWFSAFVVYRLYRGRSAS
jgi:ABC-type sugar transport system permease subunit